MEDLTRKKRVRDDPDESPEVKRIREDLLGVLDDPDPDPATQDLDSLMRSFEKEIAGSDVSQSELGFLFEASDDELGLPTAAETVAPAERAPEKNELWEIPNYEYDAVEFGVGDGDGDGNEGNKGEEYVALDGGFDYVDVSFGSSDLNWLPESLPAV